MPEVAPSARLRVKALLPKRRRAGFAFSRQPADLTRDDLPTDTVEGLEKLLALASDPQLKCVFVDEDGNEEPFTAEKVEQLKAAIEELKAHSSSGGDPTVTDDAAASDALSPASGELSGVATSQAASSDTSAPDGPTASADGTSDAADGTASETPSETKEDGPSAASPRKSTRGKAKPE